MGNIYLIIVNLLFNVGKKTWLIKPISSWIIKFWWDVTAANHFYLKRHQERDWISLTHWKRPWCLERLKAGGEGDNRGWDSWMASLTWWTWVWASSGSWWWTGKPGLLQSIGSQNIDATECLNWTKLNWSHCPRKHEVFQSGWCIRHFFVVV